MIQPVKRSQPKEPPPLTIDKFGGNDFSTTPTQVDIRRSPDTGDTILDEHGKIDKRLGYIRLFQTSLGPGQINGMFEFKKKDGSIYFLIAWGTQLYTQTDGQQPTSVYSGLANARARFFVMQDKCYIMDGTHFLTFDGLAVSEITPYIPTLTLGRPPAGGGTPNEDFNLIGAGFKDSFDGNGSATVYQLSLTNLDATTLTAVVNGVNKVETTDFSVNRTTGIVTFNSAPTAGTNNVVITAYKTQAGFADRVKKCTKFVIFGGSNDTRVHIAGNPDYKNYLWRCALYDPTYWPENSYNKIGSDSAGIMGFAKQYDTAVILKESSPNDTKVWTMTFELDSNGKSLFPVKPVNDAIDCISGDTAQSVENYPTWLSSKGVYRVKQSALNDERNVRWISKRVDPKLLQEPNLNKAASFDYDNKYGIAVNGKVYVLDYTKQIPDQFLNQEVEDNAGEWLVWNNIPAGCFLMRSDGYLYFGSNSGGLVYRFKKKTDTLPYNDDGQPINAYWKSTLTSFGADEYTKLVEKVFFSLKPSAKAGVDAYFVTDKKSLTFLKSTTMDLFDFSNLDFSRFTFRISDIPVEIMNKVKAKKITHFQLILQNNRLDESMGILSVGFKYHITTEVK